MPQIAKKEKKLTRQHEEGNPLVAPCKALPKGNGDNNINTAAFFFLPSSIGLKFIGVLL